MDLTKYKYLKQMRFILRCECNKTLNIENISHIENLMKICRNMSTVLMIYVIIYIILYVRNGKYGIIHCMYFNEKKSSLNA